METKKLCYLLLFYVMVLCFDAYSADVNDIRETVTGSTDFAFSLYNRLLNDPNAIKPKGNLFFSPYSISTALAMTYGGARGETQKQIATALHFTLPDERLHAAFGDLQKQLIQEDKTRGYQLLLANALWGKTGEPFLKDFLELNQNYYTAGLELLDFFTETEQSRQIINSWVEKKTKDKIKDLIPQGGIEKDTLLVLTNAIYFKGEWKFKFEKENTKKTDFFISSENKVKVNMMHIKEKFRYYADEKMQVLELPYKGSELSMLVILPNDINNFKEIESTLTTEKLSDAISKMKTTDVDVYLPKFKIVWGTFSLNKTLIELGMPDAFDSDKADFSGIIGKRGVWISGVFHKAFVEVNEEGTEAAAATGVVIVQSIEIEPVFRADHPFIFIIRDNCSGSILFMGRMMNPSE